jgi:EAL domain-containing protein (putative c-di-GMP-specific phosphodiesterase class I)
VDFAQGYTVGRPVPIDTLLEVDRAKHKQTG